MISSQIRRCYMSTQPAEKKKLKWHRFLQIVGLPLSLVTQGINLLSMISDIFGLNLPFANGFLKQLLAQLGTDVFHLGPYFWPVVGILTFTLFSFILTLFAWIGSFRWRSYSWKCWLVLLFFNTLSLAASMYFSWIWLTEKGGLVIAAEQIKAQTGREIAIDSTLVTSIKISFIVMVALTALYFLANLIYYFKRRKMYRIAGVQQPYETDDDEDELYSHEPYRHEPQQQPLKPASEETELLDLPLREEEQQPEKDEIADLLEDVENDITSLKKEEAPPAPVFEPLRALPPEAEEIPDSRIILPKMQEEENVPIILSSGKETPAKQEEPEYIPAVKNFCPQCGTRIANQDMNFCIHCGKRIR